MLTERPPPRVTVIVPAFEEEENIGKLLDLLKEALSGRPEKYEILVVVDYSPREQDRTCIRVREKKKEIEDAGIILRCILRKYERGLASAAARGIDEARGDIIVVMDADLQHPPDMVPKLVEALKDVDMVVASRFTEGSKVKGLSKPRLLASTIFSKLLRRIVCGAWKTTDPLAGFFAVRKEAIPPGKLKPRGYKILLEILGRNPIIRVKDLPFTFEPREAGASKLNSIVVMEGLVQLMDLSRIHVFTLVGFLGLLVNLGVMKAGLWLLPKLSLGQTLTVTLASALGIGSSILFNFIMHEYATFKTRMKKYEGKGPFRRLLHYTGASIVSILVTIATATGFSIVGLNPLLGQLVGVILGFVANWLLSAVGVGDVIEPVWKCEWRMMER